MKKQNGISPGLSSKSLILWYLAINHVWYNTIHVTSTSVQEETQLIAPKNSSNDAVITTTNEELELNSTSSFLATPSNDSDPSRNVISVVSDKLRATVAWSAKVDPRFQVWRIVVPENLGFVVEFHDVDMTGDDHLEIYSIGRNSSVLKRNFTKVEKGTMVFPYHYISRAPLLLYEREMVIRIHSTSLAVKSIFNLSYTALNESLPPLGYLPKKDPTESDVIYNCTGMRRLPEVIICDGIRQCAGGEDEANCSYTRLGCGDWVPYKNYCLKITFVRMLEAVPGDSHITIPLQAEYACQSQYNATLALLPDYSGIRIVVDLIRQSGFQTVAVGIKKVKPVSRRLRHLYRYLWQWGEWGSPVAYEQQHLQRTGTSLDCAMLVVDPSPYLQPVECVLSNPAPQGYVCMRPNPTRHVERVQLPGVTFPKPASSPDQFPTKVCADGSLVQTFHQCQWDGMEMDTEEEQSPSGFKLFQCDSKRTIHYSLLCDGKGDCDDHSDERHCKRPQFSALLASSFICRNGQAVSRDKKCNGVVDCFDESDEESCVSCGLQVMCRDVGCVPRQYTRYFSKLACPTMSQASEEPLSVYLRSAIKLDGYGMSRQYQVPEEPGELFCCRERFCIPSFLVNNGEQDCPEGEDEGIPIQNVMCPGFYRCHGSGSCVHKEYVCDGIYHCPDKDDELYCHDVCPADKGCVCEGQAYTCPQMIDPLQHLHVRYLDLSHATGISLENVNLMEYLFYLNLSFCQLSRVSLANMPQLQTLDLSSNHLTELYQINLCKLTGLKFLDLSNNPFMKSPSGDFKSLPVKGDFLNLRILKMVNVSLKSLEDKMFMALSKLEHLDMRNNHIVNIGKDSLLGLRSLEVLYTDESKLCCGYFHPSLSRCVAPVDELSSCSDLLAQDFFRVCLWTISVMAITGNAGVLVYRVFINTQTSIPTFRILVMNLCASDLLMGVYMMIIGLADVCFHGMYVAKEPDWTNSLGCVIAGVLSFVSSEVSTFVICLITIDRILVICFPLNARVHLSRRAAITFCCVVWLLGLTLAVVPILTGMEFYGQNGICLPLPITRRYFSGQMYAFSVFIILNFVLFLVIGAGQVCIYRALQQASMVSSTSIRREQDFTVTRRLFLVVFTDFCCWFPIGLLGILACSGVPISGQVNVWAAIFVLPVNSALNPFLYTLNHLKEQWKRKREVSQRKSETLTNTFRRY